jgi:hypothetical protein
MREFDTMNRRIAAFTACFDPVDFEHIHDHSLARRRYDLARNWRGTATGSGSGLLLG